MRQQDAWVLMAVGVSLLVAVIAGICLKPDNGDVVLGFVGAISAFWFFQRNNALETARFKRDLFVAFNAKYDSLNNDLSSALAHLSEGPDHALCSKQMGTLEDYFNLCGEEYYYYRKGYVDDEVWRNWLRGMYWWYDADKRIADCWNKELRKNSYYGLTVAVLEQGKLTNTRCT